MRYDFGDQIQVRYRHSDGEEYDTWVSGEEALQRLRSAADEERLGRLRNLDWAHIRELQEQLPETGARRLQDAIQERVGDILDDLVGGNIIGDSLVAGARGDLPGEDADAAERQRWQAHLRNDAFYAQVLELAWIQLRGSFPEEDRREEPGDWI